MGLITTLALGAGAVALIKGIDSRLEITEHKLSLKGLPDGFDGFRIAHISDLHSQVPDGLFEKIKEHSPEIIVITGDMIHDDNRSFSETAELIERLSAVAPCYMVSGNHDLWNTRFPCFIKRVSGCGAVLLDNKKVTLHRKGDEISLCGIADPFGKSSEIIDRSLAKSFTELGSTEGFKMLLFHRANLFPRLSGHNFDLILSGHMHGGQFRLLGHLGLLPPKSSLIDSNRIIFPKYTEGIYSDGTTAMIVNRGIGNPMIIPRLYNRPEIGIITLETEDI